MGRGWRRSWLFFFKDYLDSHPVPVKSVAEHYGMDGDRLERQYKEHLSGYREWRRKEHAEEWLLFPENMGGMLSIDETAPSQGELYTIVSNKEAHNGKGSIVAVVRGTRSEDVIGILEKIPAHLREKVSEITLDMAGSMRRIARTCFRNATVVIDRFHVQKLAMEAVQEERVRLRWKAIEEDNRLRRQARDKGERYEPETLDNGDTRRELLVRSRYLLYKSPEDWFPSQKERAKTLFREYPSVKQAYSLSNSLRQIFNRRSTRDSARLNLARWYTDAEQSGIDSFHAIMDTIQLHCEEILNYYNNRSTNASAEQLNSKIKAFRKSLRGVQNLSLFFFRLSKIYA